MQFLILVICRFLDREARPVVSKKKKVGVVLFSKAAVGSSNERNAAPILGTVSMGKGRRRAGRGEFAKKK